MPISTSEYIWIALAIILSAIPIIMVKLYLNTNNIWFIVTAILLSIFLILTYIYIVKNYRISIIYPIIKILSVILVVVVGIFLFGEKITWRNVIGIILGLVGIYLLL